MYKELYERRAKKNEIMTTASQEEIAELVNNEFAD
jgi:hypothetical protein